MEKKEKIKRVLEAFDNCERAIQRRKKQKALRMFVEDNEDINLFNYWFYRFFTRRFENWMIEKFIK